MSEITEIDRKELDEMNSSTGFFLNLKQVIAPRFIEYIEILQTANPAKKEKLSEMKEKWEKRDKKNDAVGLYYEGFDDDLTDVLCWYAQRVRKIRSDWNIRRTIDSMKSLTHTNKEKLMNLAWACGLTVDETRNLFFNSLDISNQDDFDPRRIDEMCYLYAVSRNMPYKSEDNTDNFYDMSVNAQVKYMEKIFGSKGKYTNAEVYKKFIEFTIENKINGFFSSNILTVNVCNPNEIVNTAIFYAVYISMNETGNNLTGKDISGIVAKYKKFYEKNIPMAAVTMYADAAEGNDQTECYELKEYNFRKYFIEYAKYLNNKQLNAHIQRTCFQCELMKEFISRMYARIAIYESMKNTDKVNFANKIQQYRILSDKKLQARSIKSQKLADCIMKMENENIELNRLICSAKYEISTLKKLLNDLAKEFRVPQSIKINNLTDVVKKYIDKISVQDNDGKLQIYLNELKNAEKRNTVTESYSAVEILYVKLKKYFSDCINKFREDTEVYKSRISSNDLKIYDIQRAVSLNDMKIHFLKECITVIDTYTPEQIKAAVDNMIINDSAYIDGDVNHTAYDAIMNFVVSNPGYADAAYECCTDKTAACFDSRYIKALINEKANNELERYVLLSTLNIMELKKTEMDKGMSHYHRIFHNINYLLTYSFADKDGWSEKLLDDLKFPSEMTKTYQILQNFRELENSMNADEYVCAIADDIHVYERYHIKYLSVGRKEILKKLRNDIKSAVNAKAEKKKNLFKDIRSRLEKVYNPKDIAEGDFIRNLQNTAEAFSGLCADKLSADIMNNIILERKDEIKFERIMGEYLLRCIRKNTDVLVSDEKKKVRSNLVIKFRNLRKVYNNTKEQIKQVYEHPLLKKDRISGKDMIPLIREYVTDNKSRLIIESIVKCETEKITKDKLLGIYRVKYIDIYNFESLSYNEKKSLDLCMYKVCEEYIRTAEQLEKIYSAAEVREAEDFNTQFAAIYSLVKSSIHDENSAQILYDILLNKISVDSLMSMYIHEYTLQIAYFTPDFINIKMVDKKIDDVYNKEKITRNEIIKLFFWKWVLSNHEGVAPEMSARDFRNEFDMKIAVKACCSAITKKNLLDRFLMLCLKHENPNKFFKEALEYKPELINIF